MKYSVIILAAGVGSRTGLAYNKMFYQLDEQKVIEKTVDVFEKDKDCHQIILVVAKNELDDFKSLFEGCKLDYVVGGKERQDSVYNGLQAVKYPYVMIHDGARPYLKTDALQRLKETMSYADACLLAVASTDTLKVVKDGKVEKTLDRNEVYQAQTPQAFKTSIIKRAYQKVKDEQLMITDDVSAVEHLSDIDIYQVMGDYSNIKITTSADLSIRKKEF